MALHKIHFLHFFENISLVYADCLKSWGKSGANLGALPPPWPPTLSRWAHEPAQNRSFGVTIPQNAILWRIHITIQGFRDQKVAGSNPVTSTRNLMQGVKHLAFYFVTYEQNQPHQIAAWVQNGCNGCKA